MHLLKREKALLSIYSCLYTLAIVCYLPRLLYRIQFQGKHRVNWKQRLGLDLPCPAAGQAEGAPLRIWIHAVSVGEVKAVQPLVRWLSRQEQCRLFLSTTTETGQQLADELFGDQAAVFYFPLDWRWTCRRFLQNVRPNLILLAETELWPNFIHCAAIRQVPIVIVNGRLSDRSFRNYFRGRFFFRPILRHIRHFCVQTRQDKERLKQLGIEEERVNWVGNLKYDYQLETNREKERVVADIDCLLRRRSQPLLWLCGSTREGEEEILLPLYESIAADFPSLKLILAPRHPHRGGELMRLLEKRGHRARLRSQQNFTDADCGDEICNVFVLDSIGELAYLYRIADLVFIGGSLLPFGGHNIIEAAAFGKPILFGPHMANFREIADAFVQGYAALQVRSPQELEVRIRDLLKDRSARAWLGRNARKVIRDNQGAIRRTLEIVSKFCGREDRQK